MSTLVLGLTVSDLIGAALFLPLLAAVINAVFAGHEAVTRSTRFSSWVMAIGIGSPFLTFALTLLVTLMIKGGTEGVSLDPFLTWFTTPPWRLDFSLWLDPLSISVSLTVTALSALIGLYSISALQGRKETSRTLSLFNFILFSLLLTLLADELPIVLIGWEGLALGTGLLLYVVRGKSGHSRLGIYTFALSRFGNLCFWLGLALLVHVLSAVAGEKGNMALSFKAISHHQDILLLFAKPLSFLFLIPAMIYMAQFPLSLWLLRASRGELSVVTWISSVGMITAGIYLIARLHFIFLVSESALQLMVVIGLITALTAAFLAIVQISAKRLLLYSVISQAGLVLVSFGAGAFSQGLYHWLVQCVVVTLLFLSVGILLRFYGNDDLFQFKGVRRGLPVAFLGMVIGCASLAGLLPTAGFFSRYQVLWHLFSHSHYVSWGTLCLVSVLTAFYAGRLLSLTFLRRRKSLKNEDAGEEKSEPADKHPSPSMRFPVVILALAAFLMAWPGLTENFYGEGLFRQWLVPVFEDYLPIRSEAHGLPAEMVLATATFLVLFHVGLVAVILYSQKLAWIERRTRPLHHLLTWMRHSFYYDRGIERFLIRPFTKGVHLVFWRFLEEKLLAGVLISGAIASVQGTSRLLVRLQSGIVQHYLLWFFLGAAALILWFIL